MKDKGRVFLVDDDSIIVSMLSRALKNEGYEVRGESSQFDTIVDAVRSWFPDVVLLDVNLPGTNGVDILSEIRGHDINTQVIMLTSEDNLETAVKCMKLGAADYLTKPFNVDEVKIVIGNIIEKGRLKLEVGHLRKFFQERFEKEFIGECAAVRELKSQMEKIAFSGVPSVLITGESGVGKELVARSLHRMMHEERGRYAPYIAVNCSALPETLLESELFGYEKGAFTDAKAEKKGIFELGQGGTILLDEIGEMKMELQSKLLRVLEERTVRRVGGREEIPIEVTVIATTNRNISEAIERGDFRMDLYYRLNIFSLHIPPLRERDGDLSLFLRYFLDQFCTRYNNKNLRGVSREAEELLYAYQWPGNVRELKNVIERIVVLEREAGVIEPGHLPKEILSPSVNACLRSDKKFVLPEGGVSLDELEKDLILQALERAKNNKTLAAKLLNISYDSFRYQIKKLGLEG